MGKLKIAKQDKAVYEVVAIYLTKDIVKLIQELLLQKMVELLLANAVMEGFKSHREQHAEVAFVEIIIYPKA